MENIASFHTRLWHKRKFLSTARQDKRIGIYIGALEGIAGPLEGAETLGIGAFDALPKLENPVPDAQTAPGAKFPGKSLSGKRAPGAKFSAFAFNSYPAAH
ncbi:MAG: hypothetical protein LBK63_08500 [Treponema sp.]|nr:hypothetical protein [Treponema sp.]